MIYITQSKYSLYPNISESLYYFISHVYSINDSNRLGQREYFFYLIRSHERKPEVAYRIRGDAVEPIPSLTSLEALYNCGLGYEVVNRRTS